MTTTQKRLFAIGTNPMGMFFGPKEQIVNYNLDNILEISDFPEKYYIDRPFKLVSLSSNIENSKSSWRQKELNFYKFPSQKNGEIISKQLYTCYCLNISWGRLVTQMFKYGCNQFEVLDGNILYDAIINSNYFDKQLSDPNKSISEEALLIKDYIFGITSELPNNLTNKQIVLGLEELFRVNITALNIHNKRSALNFVRTSFKVNNMVFSSLNTRIKTKVDDNLSNLDLEEHNQSEEIEELTNTEEELRKEFLLDNMVYHGTGSGLEVKLDESDNT